MDIKQVKKEKQLLEEKIKEMIVDFENRTECCITYIDIATKQSLGKKHDIMYVRVRTEIDD